MGVVQEIKPINQANLGCFPAYQPVFSSLELARREFWWIQIFPFF